MRYFTVATTQLTDEQNAALVARWKGYPWWHYVANFWLIKDASGSLTASVLRDHVREVAPFAQAIVLEVRPTDWAGLFPIEGPARDWLKNAWPPESV